MAYDEDAQEILNYALVAERYAATGRGMSLDRFMWTDNRWEGWQYIDAAEALHNDLRRRRQQDAAEDRRRGRIRPRTLSPKYYRLVYHFLPEYIRRVKLELGWDPLANGI